ncbi:archaellin/type IV pilin N-terminal domain-containing protein [Natrialbaceae archaeon A-CW3]
MGGDSRGVTPVVGLILLIGIAVIGSLGIFVVGADLIAAYEQEAENERAEQSFVELKQSMVAQGQQSDVSRSVELDIGEGGAIIRDDAGSISVDYTNLSKEFKEPITFGAIEYEGHDGTIYALEGGAVVRGTGENAQMVSGPRIEYDNETNTLNYQLVEAVGDGELESDSINLKLASSEGYSSIVENEQVIITIESRYWGAWEEYFINEIGERGVLAEQIEGSDKGKVRVDLGRINRPTPFENAVHVRDDPKEPKNPVFGGIDGKVANNSTLEAIDDEIWKSVATAQEEEYTDKETLTGGTLNAGEYYADEVDLTDDLTVNLEDGDVVLVVNGSLDVNNEFRVENWGENELRIYTTGDLHIGDQMCVDQDSCDGSFAPGGGGSDDNGPPFGGDSNGGDSGKFANSSHLQVYGTSDFQFTMSGNTYFEGVIYAPAGENGSSSLVLAGEGGEGGGNAIIAGSVVVGSVEMDGASGITHDKNLEFLDPAIGEAVQPPEITYLNIAHQQIEVTQD